MQPPAPCVAGANSVGQLGGQGSQRCSAVPHPIYGLLEPVNVPVEGWIIDLDVHCLLDGHCGVVCLPPNYGEIVQKCTELRVSNLYPI